MNPGVFQTDTLFHGRYRILRCLKSGGMGSVYEVLDEATSARRALKVMLPSLVDSEDLRARFALEARITGTVESDHIVRTSDAGVDAETATPFLVMELLRGEDLGTMVRRRSGLPAEEVAVYLFQVALALDKTHAAGIVHRDLKPDNLFLTLRDDGAPCVKILDFGIAKFEQHHMTVTRQMVGTPVYMAPEQIRAERDVGPRADVHALGHVAYTLLVGEPYWSEESDSIPSPYLLAAEILRGPEEPPTSRAHRRRGRALPEGFDVWFMTATALRAEDRFERASFAVDGLRSALDVPLPRVSLAMLLMDPPAPSAETPGWKADDATIVSPRKGQIRQADLSTVSARDSSPGSASKPAAPPATGGSPPRAEPKTAPGPYSAAVPSPRSPASSPRPVPTVPSPRPNTPADSKRSETLSRRDRLAQRRFTIAVDARTRILKLKVWGFWDVPEGKAYLDDFRQKAAALHGQPWYVLADISEFAPQKAEVNAFVEQTMAYAQKNGMVRAANLVSSALTRMQIARLSADTGLPEFSFFTSEEAATAWLLGGG